MGPADFLSIESRAMIDISVPNATDLGGVFRERHIFSVEPAICRLGSGKAEIQRIEQALRRDWIERKRGVAGGQLVFAGGGFEPGSLRRAIAAFALIPASIVPIGLRASAIVAPLQAGAGAFDRHGQPANRRRYGMPECAPAPVAAQRTTSRQLRLRPARSRPAARRFEHDPCTGKLVVDMTITGDTSELARPAPGNIDQGTALGAICLVLSFERHPPAFCPALDTRRVIPRLCRPGSQTGWGYRKFRTPPGVHAHIGGRPNLAARQEDRHESSLACSDQ